MGDYVAYINEYSKFVRDRITELRLKKGISEYKMSCDLGQNKNYIQGITSGRFLPKMAQFLSICEYFEITPELFFGSEFLYPELVRKVMDELRVLNEDDLEFFLEAVRRYKRKD